MSDALQVLLGKGETQVKLPAGYANRHGLIAGATGTGKTVSLQVMAEGFSRLGVPVFLTDVKGDLSGLSEAGTAHPKIDERVQHIGLPEFAFRKNPVIHWDLNGAKGHPVRATITDMGPALLSQLMQLNDTQSGLLSIAFKFADDEGILMLDLKDLQATLRFIAENATAFKEQYGNVSSSSIGAIQRRLLVLEEEGVDDFFGEPALRLKDLMRTTYSGEGFISLLNAESLMTHTRLYATFLLWLLSELFEELPEVGDLDKPKFVFFFDEAHLLFNDAPKALVQKVETVVKLIRSKGVGVYFVTQNPMDIPDTVLGQLGNRVQHALRAFTPRDQKAVRVAAQTMRANPAFDTAEVISELGTGEALVTVLQDDGTPSIVQRVLMCPPTSRIGPATEAERQAVMSASPVAGDYDEAVDRESAFEILAQRTKQQTEDALKHAEEAAKLKEDSKRHAEIQKRLQAQLKAKAAAEKPRSRSRQTITEAATKTFVRSISSGLARQVVRGLLGSIMR